MSVLILRRENDDMEASGADRSAARDRAVMLAVPPPATLSWLLTRLGAAQVVAVDVMRGGSTAAMHRVTVRHADGTDLTVVLRRYVAAEALLEAPTVVMSLIEGRPLSEPKRRSDWLDQLVDALIGVHAIEIPDEVNLPAIRRYDQVSYAPPRWAEQPQMWETAVEVFHDPIPDVEAGFVHRDFHPGNALWRRNKLAGVVDWQAACRGPASIDPAHLRMNLLLYDASLAEELRVTWQRRSGATYHPWGDVMSIIGYLDNLRDQTPGSRARHAIETALAHAVGALGQ